MLETREQGDEDDNSNSGGNTPAWPLAANKPEEMIDHFGGLERCAEEC